MQRVPKLIAYSYGAMGLLLVKLRLLALHLVLGKKTKKYRSINGAPEASNCMTGHNHRVWLGKDVESSPWPGIRTWDNNNVSLRQQYFHFHGLLGNFHKMALHFHPCDIDYCSLRAWTGRQLDGRLGIPAFIRRKVRSVDLRNIHGHKWWRAANVRQWSGKSFQHLNTDRTWVKAWRLLKLPTMEDARRRPKRSFLYYIHVLDTWE